MADRKISELTNITGANLADGDELVVVDTSASETKAITFGEFKNALDTSTGFVSITGDTMTGDLILNADPSVDLGAATKRYVDTEISGLVDSAPATLDTLNELAAALGDDANFSTTVTNSIATKLPLAGGTMTGDVGHGDNVKATFGASNDLQIYHDGGASYISDQGTGSLKLLAQDFVVKNAADSANMIYAQVGGPVQLYQNGTQRLATTTSGIDVTGTITADEELAIESASGYGRIEIGGPSGAFIDLKSPFSDDYDGRLIATGSVFAITGGSNIGVDLQYNGSTKLATTATGLNAFSELILDPLGSAGGDTIGLDVVETGNNTTNMNVVRNFSYDSSNQNLVTFYNNADVGFYDEAGGTQRMLWDASDEALEFGDSVKATFGASADLQLFHDSASSSNHIRVDDATQSLQIRGGSEVIVGYGTEKGVRVIKDGAVQIRYDDSTKLETTSNGINVTGRIDADDAIAVEGSSPRIQVQDTDGTNQFSFLQHQGEDAVLRSRNDTADGGIIFAGYGGGSTTNRAYIAPNGDISFYEDTGTTAKFFWDASNESLGIGTTSPATAMHVNKAFNATDASAPSAILADGSYGGGIALDDQAQSGWYAQTAGTVLKTYVGRTVGTDTAQSQVVMSQYANGNLELYDDTHSSTKLTWDATAEELQLASGVALELNGWTITESGGSLYFATGGTNKMKLDASGNLDVVGSVNSNATIT